MSARKLESFSTVIKAVRTCSHQAKAVTDEMHGNLGVTGAMRSTLESLIEGGAQTVPQVARSKGVSRQHIQTVVDALLAAGLVKLQNNPAHKRSSLVSPSAAGKRAFKKIRKREDRLMERLSGKYKLAPLQQALETLERITADLEKVQTASGKGDK